MPVIEIQNLAHPGVEIFSNLTERQLRSGENGGIFIAESPKVIKIALEKGYEPVSLLCEAKHIEGDARDIVMAHPEMNIYTGSRDILAHLTGYTLTRGVLCAFKRKPAPDTEEICRNSKNIAVLEGVCDTTNIGALFRCAAALGIDGILLTPDTCDPFNRRCIRVSMGSVFLVPWAFSSDPIEILKNHGFTTIAMTLHQDSVSIADPVLKKFQKKAIVLGTEGDGLSKHLISKCDFKAIIPMHHNVDSLNVGAAASIAFWELVR